MFTVRFTLLTVDLCITDNDSIGIKTTGALCNQRNNVCVNRLVKLITSVELLFLPKYAPIELNKLTFALPRI